MATAVDLASGRHESAAQEGRARRMVLFTLFLICEAAIFVFGSYYFDVFPTNKNLAYNLSVSAVFLAASLWLRHDARRNRYWLIVFAFFVASAAYPVTALLDDGIRAVLGWAGATPDTSRGLAIEKLCEATLKVVPILALVSLSGADLGSIYLRRGNWRIGAGVGLLVFFFLAPAALMFAAQRFTGPDTLMAAVAWGIVFSIANGFMEELWLRGIFLKRFQPILGVHASVWLTSIIFAAMHSFAFYFMPAAIPFFAVNTLALGLACGYLMLKSDSLWGPVIIHAASDFFLFVAVLANV